MNKKRLFIFLIVIILAGAGIWYVTHQIKNISSSPSANSVVSDPPTPSGVATSSTVMNTTTPTAQFAWPIDNARARITKKTFGLKVSPGHSPVSPERFSGYHTGVDFETFPNEQTSTVRITAICSGPLEIKKWATGYGGVVVQECQLAGKIITVIYGHLNINSVKNIVGRQITAGQEIGILGRGYSQETDGERKHLHLGIHLGKAVNILGYVATPAELTNWLDPVKYLGN